MNAKQRISSRLATEPSTGRIIRAFLADGNPCMLGWLAQSLSLDQRVTIVGSATDGHKTFQSAILSQPDLVLIDLHMPGLNVADVIRWLKQLQNPPVVFVVTPNASLECRVRSLAVGADAFFIKDEDLPDQLQMAIQTFFAENVESTNQKPLDSRERFTAKE